MAFVSFAYDMIYGVSSNFFKSVFDSSKAKLYRYDLHSGLVDTLGSHDDMATCIGYSNETCNLLIPLFISGSELQSNMTLMDTIYALEWK